jgi:preprotein translocase subunit YajC
MNQVFELAEGAAAQEPNTLISFLPFIAMFAILYFLMIRPQRKRQRERMSLLAGLKKGDKIVTIGGLHGTIVEIDDQTVVLKVNDVTKLTYSRSAIESVVPANVEKSEN